MPGIFPRFGGSFRTPLHLWVRSGGVWRDVQRAYVRSGGIWRQAFSQVSAIANSGSIRGTTGGAGGTATATLTFLSTGGISFAGTPSDSASTGSSAFLSSVGGTNGTGFWVRATATSGSVTTGAIGAWSQANSNLVWTKSGPSGSAAVNLSIDIATDSSGVNIVSAGNAWTLAFDHAPF